MPLGSVLLLPVGSTSSGVLITIVAKPTTFFDWLNCWPQPTSTIGTTNSWIPAMTQFRTAVRFGVVVPSVTGIKSPTLIEGADEPLPHTDVKSFSQPAFSSGDGAWSSCGRQPSARAQLRSDWNLHTPITRGSVGAAFPSPEKLAMAVF